MKKSSRTTLILSVLCFLFLFATVNSVYAGWGGSKSSCTASCSCGGCSTKGPGCFDTSDLSASPGTLTTETFGRYFAVPACIPSSCSGTCGSSCGCQCGASGYVDQLQQKIPDNSSGACGCLQKTSWADEPEQNRCCGNQKTDCGVIENQVRFNEIIDRYLCDMDENFVGSWASAEANEGDIFDVECNKKTFLSDKNNWTECNSLNYVYKTIRNHDYLCTNFESKDTWIECCGAAGCNSQHGGKQMKTGESVQDTQRGVVIYCASDAKFTTDLDIKDAASCNKAGFDWTDTLCCSEADDNAEYYNDVGGIGGCWDKKTIFTGEVLAAQKGIANFDGQFYGCNIQNSTLLQITNSHTDEPLIVNKEMCFQDVNKYYVCQATGNWAVSNGFDKSHLSTVLSEVNANPQQESGCCAQGQCWNGSTCVANQRLTSTSPSYNGFRCIDGNWTDLEIKFGLDEESSGYCPESKQCMVSPFGLAADNNKPDKNPQCITDGQFIKNDFCEQGMWTSRTKFIAQQFAEIVKNKNNYVIFCDNPDSALNELDYTLGGQSARNLISSNTNNFCVLIYDGKTILGTSLIKALANNDPLLALSDTSNCNNALSNTMDKYLPCTSGSTSEVWYNAPRQSIIFSNNAFAIEENPILANLRTMFMAIVSSISPTTTSEFSSNFINDLGRFESLYIRKAGSKEIYGTIEGKTSKRLVIQYKNFNQNICAFIQDYNAKNSDQGSQILCEKQGSIYYVVAEGSSFTKIDPASIWNDLTSKLRIS